MLEFDLRIRPWCWRERGERREEKEGGKKVSKRARQRQPPPPPQNTTTKSLPTTHSVIVKKYPALKLSVNTQSLLKHGSSNNMRGPPTIKKAARTGRITRIGRELPWIVFHKIFVPLWARKILYRRMARVTFKKFTNTSNLENFDGGPCGTKRSLADRNVGRMAIKSR